MRRLAVITGFVGALGTLAVGVYLMYLAGVVSAFGCIFAASEKEMAAEQVMAVVSLVHVVAAAMALPCAAAFMAGRSRGSSIVVAAAGLFVVGSAVWFATSGWGKDWPWGGSLLFGAPGVILATGGILGTISLPRRPATLAPA